MLMPKRLVIFLAMAMAMWLVSPYAHAQHASNDAAHAVEQAQSAESHGAGEGHGVAAGGAEHETPLLSDPSDPQTWYSALWVVIIFVVLLVVLYPTAWKNVLAGLKAREERIRKDIADAEAARAKAETTLREYNAQLSAAENRVREMISKATAEGERVAAGIRTHAQQEAEEAKERANRDIEAAGKAAVAEIHRQAADLATAIAEKIIRKNLSADDQRELVNRSLEQLQGLSKN